MAGPNGHGQNRAVKRYVSPEFAAYLDSMTEEVNRNLRAMNHDLISASDVTRMLALTRPQIIIRLDQKPKRGFLDTII